jgi:hypothetical protein
MAIEEYVGLNHQSLTDNALRRISAVVHAGRDVVDDDARRGHGRHAIDADGSAAGG